MHNSLLIRDLLKQMNANPRCLDRRDPHRSVSRDPATVCGEGEFELAGAWRLDCRLDDAVAAVVADDLRDFCARIGIALAENAEQMVELFLTPELEVRDCRLSMQPGKVSIAGGDIAGLWAGIAWCEWEMRTRRGPFLPIAVVTHHAAWPVQISQGPWGGNYSVPDFSPEYLSDDAFRLYAHFGVNNMMIYGDLLCYVQSAVLPELNCPDYARNIATLKEAAQRAARYGVQFNYVVVGPKLRADHPVFLNHPEVRGSGHDFPAGPLHVLCSGTERTLDFYRETFTNLFSEVPELAGLILIIAGESFYHCRIWPWAAHPCPRCAEQSTEEVVSTLVGVVQQAVAQAQPRATVAAWAYTTDGWERPDRRELLRQLPPDVAIYHHIEKDEYYRKDGYTKHVWDYSIDFTGPSEDMRLIADTAHAAGRPLFVKTETGIGLETFQFPYVPAMPHLAEKWQRVREQHPDGVQQSWLFFGMCGSRAEELGLWAAYGDDMAPAEFLQRIAVRDFGPAAAEPVLAAWEQMSEAVRHLPCVTFLTYYVGPGFLGPAHPLMVSADETIPDVFKANLFYQTEHEETFSCRRIADVKSSLVMATLPETARGVSVSDWEGPSDGWDVVLREYTRAANHARQAWQLLDAAFSLTTTEMDARNLLEELLLAEAVYRTQFACENTLRFLLARRDYERTGDQANKAEMRRVALIERRNAQQARPIYQHAPWLDLTMRIDGHFASYIEMIDEKVRMIDRFLSGDCPLTHINHPAHA